MKYEFESTEELLQYLKDNLLSAVEVAEILEVSKARVGQMVKQGKLTPAKNQPKMFLKEVDPFHLNIRVVFVPLCNDLGQ